MVSDRKAKAGPKSRLVLHQLRGVPLIGPGVPDERRQRGDRRRLSAWSVIYGGFRPRRRHVRRMHDGSLPIVDWHDAHLLAVSIVILLLSCADAFLTLSLLLLGVGVYEGNPLMARLIHTDLAMFAAVKTALTGAGVVILVWLSRYRMFGRIRVAKGLYLMLLGYVALVIYELVMYTYLSRPVELAPW
jgi:hypothetical protein